MPLDKMGYKSRKFLCGILFWTKVAFSILLSVASLSGMSYQIYSLHHDASRTSEFNRWVTPPIDIEPGSASCEAGKTGAAKLEPETGGLLLGFSLDWKKDVPLNIATRMGGIRGAVSNAFLQVDPLAARPYDKSMLDWHAQSVQQAGGILAITLEVNPIENISDDLFDGIAQQMRDINSKNGVPVFLRWCHEMNGDWTQYGYKPAVYIRQFRRMATAVRKYTNMTAMLWSPNVGIAYPFNPSPTAQSPPPTRANDNGYFDQLKTSTHNPNVIDTYDDPYLPYYPGDEYVDWVGLSVYYYPDQTNWNDNTTWVNSIPPPDFFGAQLLGVGTSVANALGPDYNAQTTAVRDFYTRFAVERNKPMALSESGAPIIIGAPGPSEFAIKEAWWKMTLNDTVFERFPKLKMIANFEERKDNGDGSFRDWALTVDPTIAKAYREHLASNRQGLVFGNDLAFKCDGSLVVDKKFEI